MSKRWLQCGVLAGPGRFVGWGPPAPISKEDEELAAWGELQEVGRRPEALAGGGEKQAGPFVALLPPCTAEDTGSSFSRAWPFTPGRGLWVTVAVGKAGPGQGG